MHFNVQLLIQLADAKKPAVANPDTALPEVDETTVESLTVEVLIMVV